jgi:basic amino acid/polyamine antiporter, APA family
MLGLPLDTWVRFVVWLVIGLAIYWVYGARHSKLEETSRRISSPSAGRLG